MSPNMPSSTVEHRTRSHLRNGGVKQATPRHFSGPTSAPTARSAAAAAFNDGIRMMRNGSRQLKMARLLGNSMVVLISLVMLVAVPGSLANPDAKRLYDDLLSNYNRLIRPVSNHSEIVTVRLGLKLSQLIDLNLKNQIMTTNVWMLQIWHDNKLTWEPEEYGGVTHLYVPSELLWIPDIVLYNNADGHYVVTTMTKAFIYHNGTVVWKPPAIFKSYCEIDVKYFPFDQQHCFMKFGSWTYDGYLVDLQHMSDVVEGEAARVVGPSTTVEVGMDLKEYYPSVEWDVIAVPAVRNVRKYACCEETYPDIVFNISLRRKTLFYTVNLIIPCVGISYLSVLVFYLPVDSGEKVTLCISIMLSLVMFFMLITEIMPSTSLAVPLLGKYLLFTMTLVGLSVLITIIVVNTHYREPSTHRMASWVRRLFIHFLPRLLLMKRPEMERDNELCPPGSPTPPVPPPPPPPPPPPLIRTRGLNGLELRGAGGEHAGHHHHHLHQPPTGVHGSTENRLSLSPYGMRLPLDSDSDLHSAYTQGRKYPVEIERAIMNLRFIAQHMANHDEFSSLSQDWKYVAMVMDRLFLWIFGIATVGGTFGIICQAPTLYDDRQAIDVRISTVQNVIPDI